MEDRGRGSGGGRGSALEGKGDREDGGRRNAGEIVQMVIARKRQT